MRPFGLRLPRCATRGLALVAALVSAIWLCPTPAAAEELRHAIVIGNGNYPISPLSNPVNDARMIASVLREIGFEVTLVEDADLTTLQGTVADIAKRFKKGSVALFYYAGHGVQYKGTNYLLPVNISDLKSAEDLPKQAVPFNDVVTALDDAGVGLGILILDACRNNPFGALQDALGSGLAEVQRTPGEMLIAYATRAGDVAYDGAGANSPYTSALVSTLDLPGKDIYDVFRDVRARVRAATSGKQLPWISGSIESEFIFRPQQQVMILPTGAADDITIDRVLWEVIAASLDPQDFRAFVAAFPNSPFAVQAAERERGLQIAQATQTTTETPPPPGQEQTAQDGTVAEATVDESAGVDEANAVYATTDDRMPPEPLRLWPRTLSRDVAQGLANTITDCDIEAADPDDPRRLTPGVAWGFVNTRSAIRACAFSLARDQTNARLLFQFGRVLDIAEKFREAEFFYRRAGDLNYSAALVSLGYMYREARGRTRDDLEAAKLYRRAAELGDLRGRTDIGKMYEDGLGVQQSYEEALLWYRLAAAGGWPNAIDSLGNMYRDGEFVQPDIEQAMWLYRIASELGQTNAMNNLGRLYLDGKLVKQDYKQAFAWLDRAVQSGNRYGAFNLARMYRKGTGVKKDPKKARELLNMSADLNFGPAQFVLGEMAEKGEGAKTDLEEAYFRYALALRIGEARAEERMTALATKLSPEKLAAVQQRVTDWLQLNGP